MRQAIARDQEPGLFDGVEHHDDIKFDGDAWYAAAAMLIGAFEPGSTSDSHCGPGLLRPLKSNRAFANRTKFGIDNSRRGSRCRNLRLASRSTVLSTTMSAAWSLLCFQRLTATSDTPSIW